MRITIEIDANDLSRIQKITGEKKKSPAVARALTEYLNWRQRLQFAQRVLAGKTDYSSSNKQLETRDVYETRRYFRLGGVSAAPGGSPGKGGCGILLEDELTAHTCPIRFELLSGARPEEEADLQRALGSPPDSAPRLMSSFS